MIVFLNFRGELCYFKDDTTRDMKQDTAQSGRIKVLEAYHAQHGPFILRYLNRLVGSQYAEDVFQDSFVQALSHIDKLRDLNSPRAWLFRIAHNLAMNVMRKKKMVTDIAMDNLIHSSPQEDPRLAYMRHAISELPDKHHETVMLRWYDGLSYEEIAQVLDVPVGTIRSRLHHSVGKLRMLMNVELAADP